jgi:hypothetical protein
MRLGVTSLTRNEDTLPSITLPTLDSVHASLLHSVGPRRDAERHGHRQRGAKVFSCVLVSLLQSAVFCPRWCLGRLRVRSGSLTTILDLFHHFQRIEIGTFGLLLPALRHAVSFFRRARLWSNADRLASWWPSAHRQGPWRVRGASCDEGASSSGVAYSPHPSGIWRVATLFMKFRARSRQRKHLFTSRRSQRLVAISTPPLVT